MGAFLDLRGAATGSTAPAVVFSWSAFNPSHPPGFGFTVGLGGAAPFLSTGGGAICFTGPVLGEAVFWFEASCRTGAGEGKLPEADSCQRYKGGSSNIGHLEIFFSKFKTFLQEVLEFGEENIQDTSMLVLRKTHQKKESSTCVKISSRNFDICQRFPEYGEKKEKSCHILHKVNSIIGHLEIFFSKFKTFLQEVLEFGEENFQDR